MDDAGERIITQMLVVDRVVLQPVQKRNEVMRFGNEDAILCQKVDDAVEDRMHILHMRKAICCGDYARSAVLLQDLTGDLHPEIALQRRDAALLRDLRYISRFDPKHAETGNFEIMQQRAVIRADLDD